MRQIKAAIAGIFALFAVAQASAQQFPTVPAQTVIGRLGIPGDTGPSQAIPFATLYSRLFTSLCTTSGAFPIYNATSGLWVCSTAGGTGSQAVLQGFAKFYTPNAVWSNTVGSGATPTLMQMMAGSAANPITAITPTVGISRYEAITADTEGGQNAALLINTVGNNTSNGTNSAEVNGLTVFSNQIGSGDAVGVLGNAQQSGSIVAGHHYAAFGGVFIANSTTSNNAAIGVNTFTANNSGSDCTYATMVPGGTTCAEVGVLIQAIGTNNSTAGIYILGTGKQFDCGLCIAASSVTTWQINGPNFLVNAAGNLAIGGCSVVSNQLCAAGGIGGGLLTITSNSASALSVGVNGAGNPAFVVDGSTSGTAGLKVKGATTGGTVALSVIDSGTNASLSIDAKGSGTTSIGGTSTGAVSIGGGGGGLIVTNLFTATGLVTLADLATQATNTVTGNAASGTASPTALAVASCSTAGSALKWTTNTGFGCNTSITAAAAPISGLTGAGTGVLTALAVNVGSAGAFVTFNGAGGTPSSMTATNLSGTAASLTAGTVTTNANLTGAVTSVGNAAVLGSFTSANLSTALTDETGSGAAMFGTSPVVTTDIRPASDGGADLGTSALRWGTAFTNAITASGQAARTWSMARNITAATVGQSLTVQAGGAVSGGTDLTGGNLILSTGTATGNAGNGSANANGYISFQGPNQGSGAGATSDVAPTEFMRAYNTAGFGNLCFSGSACSAAVYALQGSSAFTIFNVGSSGSVLFRVGGTTIASITSVGTVGSFSLGFGTPTIASGACGTGANGTISGSNQTGLVSIGAAATATCTVSFSATLATAPTACTITPANATAAATGTTVARVSSISTSAWVITGTALASANYYYHCI